MATLKNRAIAVLLTFAMICSVSSPVVAYAYTTFGNSSETPAELGSQNNPIKLAWSVDSTWEADSRGISHIVYTVPAVQYPDEASEQDKKDIDTALSNILHCSSWTAEDTGYLYPNMDTGTNGINSSSAFNIYVNKTLLADPVNGKYYKFSSAPHADLPLRWVATSSFKSDMSGMDYKCEGIVYLIDCVSHDDQAVIQERLSEILSWPSENWIGDDSYSTSMYPEGFTGTYTDDDGIHTVDITSSAAFKEYINTYLLGENNPVNGKCYTVSLVGSDLADGTGGSYTSKYTPYIPVADPAPDPAISGDASTDTNPEPTSGDANANSALSADSDLGSTLVTAFGLLTVVGEFALIFAWDKLPVAHKATGTLATASNSIALENGGEASNAVTADASGSFEVDVPQGDSTLTATPDEDPAAA